MHKLYGPHRLLQAHLLGWGWGKGLGCGLALSVNENPQGSKGSSFCRNGATGKLRGEKQSPPTYAPAARFVCSFQKRFFKQEPVPKLGLDAEALLRTRSPDPKALAR